MKIIKYWVVIEHLTKCWISQSVFNQLTCSWATFEGVIEAHKRPVSTGPYRPVFLRSFAWNFERPRLVLVQFFSGLGLVLRLDLQALTMASNDYIVFRAWFGPRWRKLAWSRLASSWGTRRKTTLRRPWIGNVTLLLGSGWGSLGCILRNLSKCKRQWSHSTNSGLFGLVFGSPVTKLEKNRNWTGL